MGKETLFWRNHPFWTIFSAWQFSKSVFCRRDSKGFEPGFTLIELLVVTAILGVLIAFSLVAIDPIKQLDKTKNAQRSHDILQIKNALDIYYNDHNCYPLTIPFGSEWRQGSALYMKKVPQDPDYPKNEYSYQIDTSETCPQWNVLYGAGNSQQQTGCPLERLTNCLPIDYSQLGYKTCGMSGIVNCFYISSSRVRPPAPTPTPTGESCQIKKYACTEGGTVCNLVYPQRIGDYCGFEGCSGPSCCNFQCR